MDPQEALVCKLKEGMFSAARELALRIGVEPDIVNREQWLHLVRKRVKNRRVVMGNQTSAVRPIPNEISSSSMGVGLGVDDGIDGSARVELLDALQSIRDDAWVINASCGFIDDDVSLSRTIVEEGLTRSADGIADIESTVISILGHKSYTSCCHRYVLEEITGSLSEYDITLLMNRRKLLRKLARLNLMDVVIAELLQVRSLPIPIYLLPHTHLLPLPILTLFHYAIFLQTMHDDMTGGFLHSSTNESNENNEYLDAAMIGSVSVSSTDVESFNGSLTRRTHDDMDRPRQALQAFLHEMALFGERLGGWENAQQAQVTSASVVSVHSSAVISEGLSYSSAFVEFATSPVHIIAHHLARRGMTASLRVALSLFFEDLVPWLLSLLQEIPAHLPPSHYQWLLPIPDPPNATSISTNHREISVLWEGSAVLLHDAIAPEKAEIELAASALAADILTMAGVQPTRTDRPLHDISLSSSMLAQWYIVRALQLEQLGQTISAAELANLGLERCWYSSQRDGANDSSHDTDMEVTSTPSTHSLAHPINTPSHIA